MGLKQNVAYKGILTFSNYIFGFVTFPYITRVLGPANFGLVNFALNTVDYFLLFATLGITTIGTREIAAARSSQQNLNQTFTRILSLNVWFTALSLLIYIGCIFVIPKFYAAKELFLIGAAKILFTAFAIEWFFTGLENFKYITIRSVIIKTLYVASVFIFVKTPPDYLLYFLLTIGSIVINSFINFTYSRKFVHLTREDIFSIHYLKQNFRLGVYTIMTSMYITFNVMYLGLVTDNEEVGYYSTAVKMYFIVVNMFSAYTNVMLPRMSALISGNQEKQFSDYLSMSFRLVMMTAFPVIIFSVILAPQIIQILSGPGYENAILPMRILMPALFLVWFSQVIVLQGLLPLRKDNVLLYASIIGGTLAIILNLLITPHLGAIGSAITLLGCEIAVTSYYVFMIGKYKYMALPNLKEIGKYLLLSLPCIILCNIATKVENVFLVIIIGCMLCSAYLYFAVFKRKITI